MILIGINVSIDRSQSNTIIGSKTLIEDPVLTICFFFQFVADGSAYYKSAGTQG